jgi:phospholipase/lecithinase/hemolysin
VNEINIFLKSIAPSYNASVINYPELFKKAYKKNSVEYWIWDGVHPTIFGHELMAREWIKTMSKVLSFLKKYHY